MSNKLSLKWGTLKSWNFEGSGKGTTLLNEYNDIGSCASAMIQNDTERQKQIICELIELCDDGMVYLDWEGLYVSTQEAKDYVLNYTLKR